MTLQKIISFQNPIDIIQQVIAKHLALPLKITRESLGNGPEKIETAEIIIGQALYLCFDYEHKLLNFKIPSMNNGEFSSVEQCPTKLNILMYRLAQSLGVSSRQICVLTNITLDTIPSIKNKTFWDRYWRNSSVETFYTTTNQLIMDYLETYNVSKPSHITAPACGRGELLSDLEKRYPKCNFDFFDQSEKSIQAAQKEHPLHAEQFRIADATHADSWNLDQKSDVVIASGILTVAVTSQEETEQIFNHCVNKLKQDGLLLITGLGQIRITQVLIKQYPELDCLQMFDITRRLPIIILKKMLNFMKESRR